MDRVDCIVVGAGVIGLAVAAAMARVGKEVIVLEAGAAIGEVTSSRNSEVIHAGIYYPAGSLKAQLCVRGKQLLYSYCAARQIAHRRIGKLIVAPSADQTGDLERIIVRAAANGVDDLRLLTRSEIAAAEPCLRYGAAVHSPSTGIVDSHGLMVALQGELEDHGGAVAFHAPLEAASAGNGFSLRIGGEQNGYTIAADMLINAAGLSAPDVARRIEGAPPALIPQARYAKGNYFALSGVRAPFTHLIYPLPEVHGLGVHLTLDLAGQARFGPDVEWIDGIDYAVDPRRANAFYAAIRAYWPDLPDGALVPAYSGIRPKITDANTTDADFVIQDEAEHGVPGLVNLFGIESPGLTASLAIADHVRAVLTADG
jgi:L-2-hydroxyglutarate oxidase LhgO